MATIQEKLAASLEALKQYQDTHSNWVINGQDVLGRTHTVRLVENGFLTEVIRGWYIPSMPGSEGETTVWYASYWQFVTAYLNDRYGNDWVLSAEQSLDYYGGNTMAPRQLMVRAPKASNNVLSMLHGCSLLAVSATIPEHIEVEKQHGLHLYSLPEAILYASPVFYERQPLEAQICLNRLTDVGAILDMAVSRGNTDRAGRVAGALRAVGKPEMADMLLRYMKRMGYDIREQNPFRWTTQEPVRELSPHAIRIRLMWQQMRSEVIDVIGDKMPLHSNRPLRQTLEAMDMHYVKDSYHSLSIEGYRVTEELLLHVREGKWNPKENELDADRRNALAARGYYQAYQRVRKSIEDIFEGAQPGRVFERDHQDWHFELFEPCVRAGILKISDLAGYRNHPVYIRGSRHTPLNPDAVSDAMQALGTLLSSEPDARVRAVLGHFFFGYIHPYMDGNGRTARFVMNTMWLSGGYDWLIIPVSMRDEYMKALETASCQLDIRPFCELLLRAREDEVNK